MSYGALSSVSCRTQCSRRHACFVYSLARAPSFSSILFIFLSSPSILIMPHFSPSRLRPPPVLLHPRPPIILSSTHPLHQSRAATDEARSAISEAVDRFAAANAKEPASGGCDSPSPPPPTSLPLFFSYHCVKVKKKKKEKKEAIVQGGVKGMGGRYITTKGGMWLVERDAGHS